MSAWRNEVNRIPMPAKVAGVAAAGAGFLGLVYAYRNEVAMLVILLIGIIVVAMLLVLHKMFLQWREQRKGGEFGNKIRDKAASQAGGAKNKALLDDLRKKFQDGLQIFEKTGKSVYKLPWYLVVGESGSGKSRMIEKTELSAPPRLKDPVEGAGGTVNMNWWFRNDAVFLDTAGRLMMPEVETGENYEWDEFLKLLVRARTNAPINGLLLVIPADTLETDTVDQITAKSKQISEQFARIQEALDVRFPVYVVITKCDRINGFKQFFEGMTQPEEQAQMLGWSNPEQSFNPDAVDQHLEYVRGKLLRRRLKLLEDPIHRESPDMRRLDQVDSLYIFPDKLRTLGQRLRRYLEAIFTSGEWSSNKPPLLRGIYFTSALQKGGVVDKVLSDVLGLDVAKALGEDKETHTPYFLRDLFLEKAFKEKGLVTRATDVNRMKRRRRLVLIGTGFVSVAALGAFTWDGEKKLERTVGHEEALWRHIADHAKGDHAEKLEIVNGARYAGRDDVSVVKNRPIANVHEEALSKLPAEIRPPAVYRPVAAINDDLKEMRGTAYASLFKETVMRPLIDQARNEIGRMTVDEWKPRQDPDDKAKQLDVATDALRQLIWLESGQDLPEAAVLEGAPIRPLLRFVAKEGAKEAVNDSVAVYEKAFHAVYPNRKVERAGATKVDTDASRAAIDQGVTLYLAYAKKETEGAAALAAAVERVRQALEKFEKAEQDVTSVSKQDDDTRATADATLAKFDERMTPLALAKRELDTALEDPALKEWKPPAKLADHYRSRVADAQSKRQTMIERLIAEIPESARGKRALGDAYRRLNDAKREATAAATEAGTSQTYAQIVRLEPLLLTNAGFRNQSHPRYVIHYEILKAARDRMAAPAGGGLAAGVKKVKDEHTGLLSEIAAVNRDKVLSTETPILEVCGMARFAGELAARRNLYNLINPELRQDLSTAAGWKAEIGVIEGRLAATTPRPNADELMIPFTKFDGKLEPAFDPQAVSQKLAVVDVIRREMQPGGAVAAAVGGGGAGPVDLPRPLAMNELAPRWGMMQQGLNAYRREYEDYWTRGMAARLAVVQDLKWQPFKAELKGLDASKVNATWRLVQDRQGSALGAIGGAGAGAAAGGGGGPNDEVCQEHVVAWRKLPDSAFKARDTLMGLTWERLEKDYLMELKPPGPVAPGANPPPPPTLAERYWADLFFAALGSIQSEAQANAQKSFESLKKLKQFPLARPEQGGRTLTIEEVRDAGMYVREIRGAAPDPKSVGGGARAPDGLMRVKNRVDEIRNGLATITEDDARWLDRVQSLIRAHDEGLTVTVFVGEAIPQAFRNQFFYASMELDKPMGQGWVNVRTPKGDMPLSAAESAAFNKTGARLLTRSDALNPRTQAEILKVDGPFAVITMLHRLDAAKKTAAAEGAGGRGVTWGGNLQFEYQGQKFSLPVSFKFSADVDWPSEPPVVR